VISPQDQSLSVLAKPSPPVDNVALQLYAEIVQKIPVGVRFKDNGLGDWFLGVVDEVANVVNTIGTPIMSAVDMYRTKRKKQAKKAGSKSVAATGSTWNSKPSYGSPMNVDLGDARSPAAKKRRNAKRKEKKKEQMALLRSVATPATMKAMRSQKGGKRKLKQK